MLADILADGPPRSIDDVVSIMTSIDARLPDDDGLKWFNHLYLRVTMAMRAAVATSTFHDPAFLTELDVLFGDLYFSAVVANETGSASVPSAWRPLMDERRTSGIARLQFALAGMNAHINRDLPEGIVRAFGIRGGTPLESRERREDFDRVNDLLERVEQDVKSDFATGPLADIDALAGRADDIAAMWSVRSARAAAWTNAEVLWTLRTAPALRTRFFDRLDKFTGFASRGLLIPIGEVFERQ